MNESTNNFFLIKENGDTIRNPRIDGLDVKISGEGNTVEIHEGTIFRRSMLDIGHNCHVKIGKANRRGISSLIVKLDGRARGRRFMIGKNCAIGGCFVGMGVEPDITVEIGDDCLLSTGIQFRPVDGHVIYDLSSRQVVNHPKSIRVGRHVWIGMDALFLKGASVAEDCVIGARSILNQEYTNKNVVLAGSPAKIVRTGIGWDDRFVENFRSSGFVVPE